MKDNVTNVTLSLIGCADTQNDLWCLLYSLPGERSNEVILPFRAISFVLDSDRVSQNRILRSKWPLMILVPNPSDVTKSLHADPANMVFVPEKKKKKEIKRNLSNMKTSESELIFNIKHTWFVKTMRQNFLNLTHVFFHKSALVQVMICQWEVNKPLSESMLTELYHAQTCQSQT